MLFGNGVTPETQEDEVSVEDASLITEAMLLEELSNDELKAFLESFQDVDAAIQDEILLERSIVRLDKKARISQAQKVAIFSIAKERNDPEFKKLVTIWRMERYLESRLMKKYGNQAMRRAKKTVDKAMRTKSKPINKAARDAAKRAKYEFNGAAPKMPSVADIK